MLKRKEIGLCLEKINSEMYVLMNFTDEQKNNKEIVLAAVKKDGGNLEYASNELKNDKDIVLEAVKQSSDALRYASNDLKNDKDVIREAIKNEILYLPLASEEIQDDLDFLRELKKREGELKDPVGNVKNGLGPWFNKRMKILEIRENEDFMRKSVPEAPSLKDIKKF